MADVPPPAPQLQVDIDPAKADGSYSNLAFLHLSASEFILDFARMMPGVPRAKVHDRIILTPQGAKGLLRLLETNVKNFEEQHGEIKDPRQSNANPIGFQSSPGAGDAPGTG